MKMEILLCTQCEGGENRRDERREDILDILVDDYEYKINYIKDFTEFEIMISF